MALTTGFQGYYRAQIALVGNNLVVDNGGIVGTAYITPAGGTTSNYLLNGSTGVFNLPSGSSVIYAELVLGASSFTVAPGATFDFTTPTQTVTLPYGTLSTATWSAYYQDVTSLIQAGGSGTYEVGRVNGNVQSTMWFIFIVYENPTFELNYITYRRGVVTPFSSLVLNNVFTPKSGPVTGIMLQGLTGSDINDNGTMRINGTLLGNTSNPWNGLSPYNRSSNIAPGLICVANPSESTFGLLDTRGTFGTANNNPYTGVSPNPNRTWGDIMGIDVSSALTNNINTVTLAETYTGGWFTNIVAFQISSQLAILNPTKYVDKSTSSVGDTLTYTLVYNNTGNVTADNIIIMDTIPSATSFVANSVFINGVSSPGTSPLPPSGMNLGQLPPNNTTTITFSVKVDSGTGTTINNVFNSIYSSQGTLMSALSNTVPTAIIPNPIVITKSVDKSYGTNNDTLNYTIVVSNTSTIPATDITLIDTLPSQVTFVSNSLTIDGVSNSGNPTPPSGAALNDIPGNSVSTVSFNVTINSGTTVTPLINTASTYATVNNLSFTSYTNSVTTNLVYSNISTIKTVDKSFATLGDILTYSISILNTGNTTTNNIAFIDTLPNGTTLVAGSLKQDSTVVSGTPNPPGVTLPNGIGGGSTSTVTFQVLVTTIPSPNPIPNYASLGGSFIIDATTTPNSLGTNNSSTNTVNTQMNYADLSGIQKLVDKSFATCGNTLTYTILIPNSGNATAQNIVFKDTIPAGTSFVANSLSLNGVIQSGADPSVGVTLPNIAPGTLTTVTFNVMVQC